MFHWCILDRVWIGYYINIIAAKIALLSDRMLLLLQMLRIILIMIHSSAIIVRFLGK